jgi:hypothetical protein
MSIFLHLSSAMLILMDFQRFYECFNIVSLFSMCNIEDFDSEFLFPLFILENSLVLYCLNFLGCLMWIFDKCFDLEILKTLIDFNCNFLVGLDYIFYFILINYSNINNCFNLSSSILVFVNLYFYFVSNHMI